MSIISNLIDYINSISFIKNSNPTISNIFDFNLGEILAFLIVFTAIVVFRNLIVNSLIRLIEKFLSNNSIQNQNSLGVFLKDSLFKPFSYFLYIVAFDIAIKVLYIYHDMPIWYSYILIPYGIVVIWAFFGLINNFVKFYSQNFLEKFPNIRAEMVNFFVKVFKFIILTIVSLFVLHRLEFNITALVASLGIGGLAIALAAKDTISNIFGSISIIMDNMFSQGDWIATDKGEGTVVEIGMRTTKIRTFDNALIFLPNSYLANTDIKNWNKRKVGRRIMMHIGVLYSSDMDMIQKSIQEIKDMLLTHPDIANTSKSYEYSEYFNSAKIVNTNDQIGIKNNVMVYLDRYSASSIDILIYCFSDTVNWQEWLEVKQDVMIKIAQIIRANGLDFAFPSQSVYLSNEGGKSFKMENIENGE
jgi:MscS family membrane protein